MGYHDVEREKLELRKFTFGDCCAVVICGTLLILYVYFGLWT
jgi:hypothetical protein